MGQITRTLASGSTAVFDPTTGKVTAILKKSKPAPVVNDDHEDCHNCKDGVYYISGAVVNGVFRGRTGMCFQCQGKGYTTAADRRRTDNYYRYHYRPWG